MKFIDLFSGIGGIRLDLEQAGHECVGFCEYDKFARKAYKAMFDCEGRWENHDIRTANSSELPKADLWCFGFPCQDISVAGKQRGLQDGERSGLFYEIIRLLAGTRAEDRPKWVIAENVKNLLSIGRGFDFARVLCALGEVGYECEWQVLNSKDFGVPQNRERVFIVGHLGGIGGRKVFPIAAADGENSCELQEITAGVRRAKRLYSPDGISCCLSAVGGGGGEKTGLYAVRFRYPERGEGSRQNCKLEAVDIASTLTAKHCGDPTADCCNGVLVQPISTVGRIKKQQNGKRIKDAGEPMFTLTAQEPHGVVIQQLPHGFNAGGEKDIAPTLTGSAYQHNNFVKGVYTNASKDFQRQPLEDMSRTIKAEKHDAGIYDGVRIRRLTPRECWRLQGFPDEYFDKAATVISDTQLYKAAGNAVTVNVARAIGQRLKEIETETPNQ